jgi:Wings apart-like protein regulation of heterochromatin
VTLPATRLNSSDSHPLSDAQALLESQEDLQIHETYSDLRARWGVDNSEDDPHPFPVGSYSPSSKRRGKGREVPPSLLSASSSTVNEVKSITELRNKGESRRFQDEVGYLFEGLDPESNVNIRRAG